MNTKSQVSLYRNAVLGIMLLAFSIITFTISTAKAQSGYDPTVQTQSLLYDEARTVYLGNLARRDNGIPPLRWNRQLTHAARWFSWDSTENRPIGFCGHQDTQGQWPSYRTSLFGYLGFAGAENAFCGYVTPENAIQGWMDSPGHRANLLDPNWREIGLGYYRRNSDGRGYVTQDFGYDAVYAPVIIENEAISTISQNVNLYIYDRLSEGGFTGLSTATQMMVSNNSCFSSATWEPYQANKAWTLANNDGWRKVYVKTRDKFNRTLTVSDTIYLGSNIHLNELGAVQMGTTQSEVTIYNLNGGTLPQAQFSLGWLADDTYGTFNKWWGNGERINDATAWGGSAYRLYPGDGESFAWVYDTAFIKDTPLVAYFRLKVNDNTSSSEVARISVLGGGTEHGPLSLRGTDFTASNQYQEFPLHFIFNSNPNDVFLIFQFWRSGSTDVYVDAVSIFSEPQAITSPLTWTVPGNNYRGQGVWIRYTNGSQFTAFSEATISQKPTLTVNKTGSGTGTVTSNPGGINCGSDCSEQYDCDTTITLTALPATGSIFDGWNGGGCSGTGTCTVALRDLTIVTANFTTPLNPGIYNDTDPAWTYNGTWYTYSGPGPYNNSMHFTNTPGSSAALTFEGQRFILTFTKYSNYGSIDVYIDDVYEDTIVATSPTLEWQSTWTSPILTNEAHTVRFEHPGGSDYIAIGAIQILGVVAPEPEMVVKGNNVSIPDGSSAPSHHQPHRLRWHGSIRWYRHAHLHHQ